MIELELRRVRGDRRGYVLDGVGNLRVSGIVTRKARAEADGQSWDYRRRSRAAQATDRTGAVAGSYRPTRVGRGGTLHWGEHEFELKANGNLWRESYTLLEGRRELGRLRGISWGRAPVRIELPDDTDLEPGLLLFAAFVVRGLAEYAVQ